MQLAVHNLTRTFGPVRANDGISLAFAAGQIHGVLGENGAGKSTLMKLLSGLIQPDSGEIHVNGQIISIDQPATSLNAGIGMVHQEPLDIPAFTAAENFWCASPPERIPSLHAARQQIQALSDQLGFTVPPDQRVDRLTIGQRQQLEIMRLLACGARVFILDEPTTGIAAAQARALFAALKQLAALGNTILFVSHKLDEITELCNTVSVLRHGRVIGEQLAMPIPKAQMVQLMFGELANIQPAEEPVMASQVATPTWQLDQITLREGMFELNNLQLHVAPGTITGLAGLDGSGQQVLLRLLAGLQAPAAGTLSIKGRRLRAVTSEYARATGICYVPANRLSEGIIGAMSLAEHIAIQDGTGMLVDLAKARDAARHAIEQYAIKATPDLPLAALSGGNQQRAMLALLPAECSGILLEQPTRGLDVASAQAIWQRLIARRNSGAAIVFASADLEELLRYSDQILVFFGGQVSAAIPRHELNETRLAEMIGGVGFVSANETPVS
jgi:general nucleoside transport system ATP-binding protein